MTSLELKLGACFVVVTILAVAVLLESSQTKPVTIPISQSDSNPFDQLKVYNAAHPLEGAMVMLAMIGCGSGLSVFLVRMI